jgi:hypothetical protein
VFSHHCDNYGTAAPHRSTGSRACYCRATTLECRQHSETAITQTLYYPTALSSVFIQNDNSPLELHLCPFSASISWDMTLHCKSAASVTCRHYANEMVISAMLLLFIHAIPGTLILAATTNREWIVRYQDQHILVRRRRTRVDATGGATEANIV